jgi:hypothetical protein
MELYRPLDPIRKQIRLCKVHPTEDFGAPIECTLTAWSLQNCPEYVALSYVWGDVTVKETITVNGKPTAVTTTLAAALRRFRQSAATVEAKRIWADAICINQNDVLERNIQIGLMGDLYSQATSAMLWLGEEEANSDMAFFTINFLAEELLKVEGWMQCLDDRFPSLLQSTTKENFSRYLNEYVDSVPLVAWDAVVALTSREYWFRVWIVQELMLPRDVVIYCGSQVLPWDTFDRFVRLVAIGIVGRATHIRPETDLPRLSFAEKLKPMMRSWSIRSSASNGFRRCETMHEFIEMLDTFSHLKATDARDRIYGLAAFAPELNFIDYSVPTEEVYKRFAALAIENDKSLFVLHFAGIDRSNGDINNNLLPSWAPDWRGKESVILKLKHSDLKDIWSQWKSATSPSQTPQFNFLPTNSSLIVDGFCCDTLQSIHHRPTSRSAKMSLEEVSKLRADLVSHLGRGMYPSGNTNFIALLLAFMQYEDKELPTGGLDLFAGFLYTCGSAVADLINDDEDNDCPDYIQAYLTLSGEGRDGRSDQAIMESLVGKDLLGWTGPPNDLDLRRGYDAAYVYKIVEKWNPEQQTFFSTTSGRFGLGTCSTSQGDVVCFLDSLTTPLILRKIRSHYILVGRCDVLGLMHEEVFQDLITRPSSYELEKFEIR